MNNLKIRPANAFDGQIISTLILRTIRETNSPDYTADIIEAICLNFSPEKVLLKMQSRDVFVCHHSDQCVGTISLEGDKLHSLFVEPDLQRQAIGGQLVAYLEEFAVRQGQTKLHLSSSITAKPFYERLGYLLIQFEEREDGSTYLMEKPLS